MFTLPATSLSPLLRQACPATCVLGSLSLIELGTIIPLCIPTSHTRHSHCSPRGTGHNGVESMVPTATAGMAVGGRRRLACILPWRLRDLMKAITAVHLIALKRWNRRNQSWVYPASPAQHFRIRPWASLPYSIWAALLIYPEDLPTHKTHCTRQEKHSGTWKAERWGIKTNCSGD